MMEQDVKDLHDGLKQLHNLLAVVRNDIHFEEFTLVAGNSQAQTILQNQQCWIDRIHNPLTNVANGNPVAVKVTLSDNGAVKYSQSIAPGATDTLRMKFSRDVTIQCDSDFAVTLSGRIKA